ncbi:hypothetical protein Cfor_04781 [Coptotermes formosanus]|uniref:Uncharacterized protein n=1 Tax=Coptotermes formosanus TaxID=36987 RepID=A0A6L2Q4M2_COPFO|nr:hypothetical protein Cfor_04781 [Coptotermes formosanus]
MVLCFIKPVSKDPIVLWCSLFQTEGREGSSWPWFRMADAVPGPSRRSEYYMHEEGQPLSWDSVEKTMEETPELWKPDLWRRNGEIFPLKDDYDIQHVLQRSPGRFGSTKEIQEGRNQGDVSY